MDAGDLEKGLLMKRAAFALVVGGLLGLGMGCESGEKAREVITVGLGERCGLGFECREYLECSDEGICEALGLQLPGSHCILTADCRDKHYCERGVCRESGLKPENTLCTSTSRALLCFRGGYRIVSFCGRPRYWSKM